MKKTSSIAKKARTRIGDLTATSSLSDQNLARVAGALNVIAGGGLGGFGGLGTCRADKCWQSSSSVVEPGQTDTAQDYVND